MKEIGLINRNSKYYVIWTTLSKLIWRKKMQNVFFTVLCIHMKN